MNIITIDKKVELLAEKYSNTLFQSRTQAFASPIDKLRSLKSKLRPQKEKNHIKYVDKIINEYTSILKANPQEMKDLIKSFNAILPFSELNKPTSRNKKLLFYECVVAALRYDDIREKEFLEYLVELGVKSCVYCNAQLTIVSKYNYYQKRKRMRIQKSKLSAKLELDHYHPKSKYPFLATSFFNLYPVCGNCNRAKSATPIEFEVYSNTSSQQPYYFHIDENSIIKYWATGDKNDLQIFFDRFDGDYRLRNDYNKTFNIQGIYDTQKDIVEEIAYKVKVYTPAFKHDLVQHFQTLFPNTDMLDRLILGNYTKENEVHMRPMAKFSQDIAKQLGLTP